MVNICVCKNKDVQSQSESENRTEEVVETVFGDFLEIESEKTRTKNPHKVYNRTQMYSTKLVMRNDQTPRQKKVVHILQTMAS